jgi:hypothetical protein
MKVIKTHIYQVTGTTAVASTRLAKGRGEHIHSVLVRWSAAPTTSEDLTITYTSKETGAAYDVVLLTYDPGAAGSVTSFVWNGPGNDTDGVLLSEGDTLSIAYTHTDSSTISITYIYSDGV